MTDYVSCPTCRGRGLIPAEDAAAIEVHASAEYDEAQKRQQQRDREMREAQTADFQRRIADRQTRSDRAAAAVIESGPKHTPEEIAALKERLDRLEAERAEGDS